MIYRLVSAALLLFASAVSIADGHPLPMWQIDGASNRIYLLGSVHLLREQDHPIPDAIYAAYDEADSLVMELDMDDIDPVATQTMINELGRSNGGERRIDVRGADLDAEAEQIEYGIFSNLISHAGRNPRWCGSTNRSGQEICGMALSRTSRSISDSRTSLNLEFSI